MQKKIPVNFYPLYPTGVCVCVCVCVCVAPLFLWNQLDIICGVVIEIRRGSFLVYELHTQPSLLVCYIYYLLSAAVHVLSIANILYQRLLECSCG